MGLATVLGQFDRWTEMFGFRGSLTILYFVICGLLPFLTLILSYEHGWLYADFYSRFFLYPLFFGWLAVFCAHAGYSYLRNRVLTPETARRLWCILLIIALGAAANELRSDNVAPWEIRPSVLNEQEPLGSGRLLSERFSAAIASDAQVDDRADFQRAMIEKLGPVSKAFETWSITRPLYIVSFFLQSLVLLYIFAAAISLALFAYFQRPTGNEYYRSVLYLSAALLVSGIWVLMTIGFLANKTRVYPDEFNEMANYAIIALYLIAVLLILVHYLNIYRTYFKESVAVLFGSGFVAVLGTQGDMLASWFGPEQAFRNSIVLLLVLAMILVIPIVVLPAVKDKPQGPAEP
jgi:hypothetical protein